MNQNIFNKICSEASLLSAWKKVKEKKAGGGIDGVSVAEFEDGLNRNIRKIAELLVSDNYLPEPYSEIKVRKVDGSPEKRILSLPMVTDKIV